VRSRGKRPGNLDRRRRCFGACGDGTVAEVDGIFCPDLCLGKGIPVIADVEMPGMSGVELQDHLIATGHTIPTIFITAFPDERVRDRALNAGAIDFLSKPFDESRLLECVEQALMNRHKPAGPPGSG
jgi:CheY-like chemotaxis protein